MEKIISAFFEILVGRINLLLFRLGEVMLSNATSATNDFWRNNLMQSMLRFSRWLGVFVFGCALIMAIFDIMEDTGEQWKVTNWATVFSSFVKGFGFAMFAPFVSQYAMTFAMELLQGLNLSSTVTRAQETVLNGTWFIVAVTILACIIFWFMSLKQFGMMLIQSMATVFYIPDIVRGETAAMGSWLRQTIAIAVTYMFQFLFFYLGLYLISIAADNNMLGIALWIAMLSVERVLQKFGMSSGVTGALSSTASAAQSAFMMLSR